MLRYKMGEKISSFDLDEYNKYLTSALTDEEITYWAKLQKAFTPKYKGPKFKYQVPKFIS